MEPSVVPMRRLSPVTKAKKYPPTGSVDSTVPLKANCFVSPLASVTGTGSDRW